MSKVPETIPELYEVLVEFREVVIKHLVKLDDRMDGLEGQMGNLETGMSRLTEEVRLIRRATQNLESQLLAKKERVLPARRIPPSATSRHPAELSAMAAKGKELTHG